MVSAVIAAFLYLRIMVSTWITDPESGDDAREPVEATFTTRLAIGLTVAVTLIVGFFPGWLIDAANAVTAVGR